MVALVINSIVGSAPFGLPSVIAGLAGRASPLAYLLAAAGIGLVMACFAEVASRFTEAGGPYLYARTAFGRFIGIEMAWLAWLVRLTAAAANANLFVIYLVEFWPAARDPLPRALVLSLLFAVLVLVNVRGVRAGAEFSNVFTIAKLSPLLVIICAGLVWLALHGGGAFAQAPVHVSTRSWLEAVLVLVFAYGGFESALMPMAEAKDPRRDAPFALFMALLTCTVVYTLVQVVVVGVLPNAAQQDRSLAAAAGVIMGRSGAVLISLCALLSVYGYLASQTLNVPRLTFALAERGDFPSFFGRIHLRFHTPWISIVIFGCLAWTLAVWGSYKWNVVLSAVARLFTYGIVSAALLSLRRRDARDRALPSAMFRLPLGKLIAALAIGFSLLLVFRMGLRELEIVAATITLAFANWLWARSVRPHR